MMAACSGVAEAGEGEFVVGGVGGEGGVAGVVEVGEDVVGAGELDGAVEHGFEFVGVEVNVVVAGGFGEGPEAADGEEAVAGGAFGPHAAVVVDAFGDLGTEAVGFVVDGDVDELLVVVEEADEADGGVDAALDVVDAELGFEEDFVESGVEEAVLAFLFFGVGEGGPDEVGAVGHADEPACFGEGLGGDVGALAGPHFVVVEGVFFVFVGVGEKELAGVGGDAVVGFELVDEAAVGEEVGVVEVCVHDAVAVEIGGGFGGIAEEDVWAGGADVLPAPGSELFALVEARAVGGADVVVGPVAAARGEVDGLCEGFVDVGGEGGPGGGGPGFGFNAGAEGVEAFFGEEEVGVRRGGRGGRFFFGEGDGGKSIGEGVGGGGLQEVTAVHSGAPRLGMCSGHNERGEALMRVGGEI